MLRLREWSPFCIYANILEQYEHKNYTGQVGKVDLQGIEKETKV